MRQRNPTSAERSGADGQERHVRVLHVGKFYPPSRGGMEKVLQVLAEGEQHVVENRILVANEAPSTVHDVVNGVRVTRAGTVRQVGSVSLCPSFPYWMRRLPADVMVVHEPNPLSIVAHAIARPSVPLVFFVHAEVVRPAWRYNTFYRPFLRRMLHTSQRIIVTSPKMIDVAQELQPYRAKCAVVPLALDANQHALTPAIASRAVSIRAESPLPLALFVGR